MTGHLEIWDIVFSWVILVVVVKCLASHTGWIQCGGGHVNQSFNPQHLTYLIFVKELYKHKYCNTSKTEYTEQKCTVLHNLNPRLYYSSCYFSWIWVTAFKMVVFIIWAFCCTSYLAGASPSEMNVSVAWWWLSVVLRRMNGRGSSAFSGSLLRNDSPSVIVNECWQGEDLYLFSSPALFLSLFCRFSLASPSPSTPGSLSVICSQKKGALTSLPPWSCCWSGGWERGGKGRKGGR